MFKKLPKKKKKKKKGATVLEGGGGDGAGGRVRVCQVNVYSNNEKGFRNFELGFGNLSFVFRSPYSTVCSHMEPSAKLGSPNWTLVEKLVAKLTTAAYDLVAKNVFWSQMATWRPDFSSPDSYAHAGKFFGDPFFGGLVVYCKADILACIFPFMTTKLNHKKIKNSGKSK